MSWFKSTWLFFLIGASFNACSQSNKVVPPNSYTAYKTQETITIDGKANEAVWNMAEWSSNFIDIQGLKKTKIPNPM